MSLVQGGFQNEPHSAACPCLSTWKDWGRVCSPRAEPCHQILLTVNASFKITSTIVFLTEMFAQARQGSMLVTKIWVAAACKQAASRRSASGACYLHFPLFSEIEEVEVKLKETIFVTLDCKLIYTWLWSHIHMHMHTPYYIWPDQNLTEQKCPWNLKDASEIANEEPKIGPC